jgi:hypothetical protein
MDAWSISGRPITSDVPGYSCLLAHVSLLSNCDHLFKAPAHHQQARLSVSPGLCLCGRSGSARSQHIGQKGLKSLKATTASDGPLPSTSRAWHYLFSLVHLSIRLSFVLENRVPAYPMDQYGELSINTIGSGTYQNLAALLQARSFLPSVLGTRSAHVPVQRNMRRCIQQRRSCLGTRPACYSALRDQEHQGNVF